MERPGRVLWYCASELPFNDVEKYTALRKTPKKHTI